MRRLFTGLFVIAAAAGAAASGVAQTRDRPPEWAPRACITGQPCTGDNKPSTADLARVFPTAAVRAGRDGDVRLNCLVTVEGQITDCRVEAESPKELGFGSAALLVVPQFSMRPAIRNGAPVAERIDIPLTFVYNRTDTQVSSNLNNAGGQELLGRQKFLNNPTWLRTPSYADMVAAYPAAAKAAGEAARGTLYCTFTPEGTLTACAVENAYPLDPSVAAAIHKLEAGFQAPASVPTAEGDLPIGGMGVMIPVNFSTRMLQNAQPPMLTAPRWSAVPSRADFAAAFPVRARAVEDLKSRVVLQCTVAQAGKLSACRVASETPAGLGFGDAAMQLSTKFVVSPWSETGAPVVGAPIRVPIDYTSATGAAPSAPQG